MALIIVAAAAAVFFQAGCSSGQAPAFVLPDASESAGTGGPDVDEKLAEEAWQKRIVFHVGPIDLPAGMTAQEMEGSPVSLRFQTDEDLWITAFEPKVVDASGGDLPAELMARAMVSNLHEENAVCGNSGSGNPAFVADGLLTSVELPQGYGYPVLSTDPLEASVVLKNPTEQSYSGVYFEITLVARPMNEFSNLTDVRPVFVEFDTCGHAPIDIEPGQFAQKSASYRIVQASRVIMVNGTLGDYGASIELVADDEIVPFWRSEATLDESHRLIALSDNPYVDMQTSLSAGESVTMNVAYDNSQDSWIKSASSGAMMYLVLSD